MISVVPGNRPLRRQCKAGYAMARERPASSAPAGGRWLQQARTYGGRIACLLLSHEKDRLLQLPIYRITDIRSIAMPFESDISRFCCILL